MRLMRMVPLALMAVTTTACPRPAEQQAVAPTTWQQEAEQTFQHFQNAYTRGDAAAMDTLFTDDAVLMPPDGPRAMGRGAIRQYYEREFAAPVMQQPAGAPDDRRPGARLAPEPVPAPGPGVPPAPGTPGTQPPGDQPPGAQPPASDVGGTQPRPDTQQQPDTQPHGIGQQQPGAPQQPGVGQQPMPGRARVTGGIESAGAAGEWGWASGNLQISGDVAGSQEIEFLAVSRRGGDGVWRIHRLMWNRAAPAGPGVGARPDTGITGGP
jgi:ketosteroid isomerase-like protein